MILMQDVEGYRVGEKEFRRGAIITDERGIVHIDQAYYLAWREAQKTGLPIEAFGTKSEYNRDQRAYVKAGR